MPARSLSPSAFSPADLLRLARLRWLSIGLVTVFITAAAVLLGLTRTPRFEASATVVLDSAAGGSLLGSLTALAPLAGGRVASGEIAVLRSRSVVAPTVREPQPGAVTTPQLEGYANHVGLTTEVRDEGQTVWNLMKREWAGPVDGRPPVLPAVRLFARAEPSGAEAPRAVRVEFLSADRVRVSRSGLWVGLGLADDGAEEFALTPGAPLDYHGLVLQLEPRGEVAGGVFTVEAVPEYEAMERLLDRYWVAETQRSSGVIRLTVEDTDPQRAAETANALAANYLAESKRRGRVRSSHTIDYIEDMLDQARTQMEEAEQSLLELRSATPAAVDLDATGEAIIERLSELELQATTVDLRASALRRILEDLEQGDHLAVARLDSAITGGLVVDPMTAGYLESLAELNTRYAELSQAYTPETPEVIEVQGAAAEVLGLIRDQLTSRLAGLELQAADLETTRGEALAELTQLPEDMLALAGPTLVLRIQTELIPELLRHLKATEIADADSSFAAQILDPAVPATRVSSPRLMAVAAVALVFGLLLGLLLAVLRDPDAGPVTSREELVELLPVPALGSLPMRATQRGPEPTEGPLVDAVRSLRAAVKNLGVQGTPVRRLGLTSTGDPAARARVSAALARSFAREGTRVVLVETDLADRSLSRLLGMEGRGGLAEALAEASGEAPGLQEGGTPGLRVLPAGGSSAEAADLLGGARFDRLLDQLAEGADLVLCDLASLPGAPHAEAIAAKLDGLLVACSLGRARRHEVQGAREAIERAGGTLLGSVLLSPGGATR